MSNHDFKAIRNVQASRDKQEAVCSQRPTGKAGFRYAQWRPLGGPENQGSLFKRGLPKKQSTKTKPNNQAKYTTATHGGIPRSRKLYANSALKAKIWTNKYITHSLQKRVCPTKQTKTHLSDSNSSQNRCNTEEMK